jgi:2-polyprenyl-6-methoxyphenol hydroxylase-like FAD-dependent oxidoreductase
MLLERFADWPAPFAQAVEGTPEEDITGLAVFDRKPVKSWGSGRVTLLGDAAHPMTTNTSQGGNQAIEDAVVLAGCLEREPDVAKALRKYEERRIARTTKLVKRSHQAANMNAWRDPVRIRFRDVLFSNVLPRVGLSDLRKDVAVEL